MQHDAFAYRYSRMLAGRRSYSIYYPQAARSADARRFIFGTRAHGLFICDVDYCIFLYYADSPRQRADAWFPVLDILPRFISAANYLPFIMAECAACRLKPPGAHYR